MARAWILLVAGVVASCSGGSTESKDEKKSEDGHGGGGGENKLFKRLVVSLEIIPAGQGDRIDAGPGLVEIAIVTADETGTTKRDVLGEFPGPCTDVTAQNKGGALAPLLAADCTGGEGLRLRVILRREKLMVMRAAGVTGDDLDLDEFQTFAVPPGVPVTSGP